MLRRPERLPTPEAEDEGGNEEGQNAGEAHEEHEAEVEEAHDHDEEEAAQDAEDESPKSKYVASFSLQSMSELTDL